MYNGKYWADYIVTKGKLPFGKPHETIVHPDDKPMSRDEFDLYDIFKTLGYITFFMAFVHLGMCKAAKKTLQKKEKTFASKMFKKSGFCFILFFLSYLFCKVEGQKMMTIIKRHVPEIAAKYGETIPEPEFKPKERNLQAWDKFVGKTTDECKADHSSEGSCNADDACVWCKCAAVPSGCFSAEDAKKLPAAVFVCDKKNEEDSKDLIDQLDKDFDNQMSTFKGDDEDEDDQEEENEWKKWASENYAPKDGKKKHCCGICPVMAILILGGLFHHWQMHGFAKSLEKVDKCEKAKKIAESKAPQPQTYVAVQPVVIQAPQKCSKVEQSPITFVPAERIQVVAPVNQSFDYSVEEPFIEDNEVRLQIDDNIPTTGIDTRTNGMN